MLSGTIKMTTEQELKCRKTTFSVALAIIKLQINMALHYLLRYQLKVNEYRNVAAEEAKVQKQIKVLLFIILHEVPLLW